MNVLIGSFLAMALFFLLFRSVALWYFRIGEQRRMERERTELLQKIHSKLISIDQEID